GVAIGDRIALPGADRKVPTKVVGTSVFPYLGITSAGNEILMTDATFDHLVAEPLNTGDLVRLRPGTDVDRFARSLGPGLTAIRPSPAPAVVRVHDATGIVAALAGFFLLLGAAVFLVAVLTTTRGLRREYAVARAMGFDRRQVRGAAAWH